MAIGPNWLEETREAKDYRSFVGAPEEYDLNGALQFNLLILLGLREHHKILDVGCGSLRAGRLFVMYLASGNYYGIDPERWLVEEAIEHELSPGLTDLRQPQFNDTVNFNAGPFGVTFDYVLCQSVYTHAPQGMIALSLREAAKVMGGQSIFAATYMESEDDNSDTHKWHYPFVTHFTRERIEELCNGAGLSYIHIDWFHPKFCRWFLACVPDYEAETESGREGCTPAEVGEMTTKDNLEAILLSVFEDTDMRGYPKAVELHKLAKATVDGDIVEIGSHHGFGTIALALGTAAGHKMPVYAVDYNRPTTAWTQETMYSQQDRFVFFSNLMDVGLCADVNVVNLPMDRAVRAWNDQSVSLLFWDPGVTVEGLVVDILNAWATKMAPDGIMALNDTDGGDLGVDRYIESNLDVTQWKRLKTRARMRIVRRRGP